MLPTAKVRKLIGGILARYQELLKVEVYSYAFLSNHFHLLIKSPQSNCDEFMENVNRELSRRINWMYSREGSLWSRRYSEQEVLTEEDLLKAFLYINTNMCKHGLVDTPSKWGGLHSAEQVISERGRRFHFYHYSKRDLFRRPLKTAHTLKLSVLPQFRELSAKKRKQKIGSLLSSAVEEIREGRRRAGRGFLGREKLLEQKAGDYPREVSKSPRPACYTGCKKAYRKFIEARRVLRERYAECSVRYRLGDISVRFPEYTYKPPLHRRPRRKPFVEMAQKMVQESFKIFADMN